MDLSSHSQTQNHHQPQQLPETAVSNLSGVLPLRKEVAGVQIKEAGRPHLGQQQPSAYYPALNPMVAAAVVALSQLAQFSGMMDVAERALAGLHAMVRIVSFPGREVADEVVVMKGLATIILQLFYRRGHSRGRGSSGPKRFSPRGELSTSSGPESSAAQEAGLTNENAEPPTDAPEKAVELLPESSLSAAPEKVVLSMGPTKAAWCELCRVNCTSLEILEQHKNGKRHKKNLQRTEELRKIVKPITEVQNEQEPVAESKIEVPQHQKFAQGGQENDSAGNIGTETIHDKNKMEADNQNNAEEQSEVPAKEFSDLQAGKPRMDADNWRCGMKWKMRGGGGGKRMKMFGSSRQPMEPPKPKVVIPLICDLCNVKCDTREVFDRHLSGKKHIAKLKRFEGHQAMYGPMGYPPNPIAQTLYHSEGHHQPPVYGSHGLFPPSCPYMSPQTHQAAVESSGMDNVFQQYPTDQAESATESGGHNTGLVVIETQQQVATVEPEIRQPSTT
ncbi:hypothetical protein Pint_15868 [Pistacia integerrima]|uniref:Uncharacterized protein n=1 Tax=Pistacia integerrima TaxID=434235 RepID=A0ACC0ZE32_9ROSI|nr:hypothetical protein Pint_15868 [Pistacia integerrima]